MIRNALTALFISLAIRMGGQGGELMLAMLFAQRIILGKNTFADVPQALKQGVADILLESDLPFLVPKEYGGTAE